MSTDIFLQVKRTGGGGGGGVIGRKEPMEKERAGQKETLRSRLREGWGKSRAKDAI